MFEVINALADILVPVYAILAIVAVIQFRSYANAPKEAPKVYKFVKKGAQANMTWKQKMAGTWEKTERTGFYEVSGGDSSI